MEPKISVIIPTYNRENFISEALESVFDQDFPGVEILVIDDGSDDNTKKVLSPYIDKIRYFYQDNKGLGEARNKGILEARGDYLAFLDSDDRWLPHKLAIQMACMSEYPSLGLCCTNFIEFDENGVIPDRRQESWEAFVRYKLTINKIFSSKTRLNSFVPAGLLCGENSANSFYYGNIFNYYLFGPLLLSSTALLKRNLALEALPHLKDHSYTHDYFLFAYISKHHPVGFIDLCLCEKRAHIQEKEGQAAQLTAEKHQIGLRTEYLKVTEKLWRDDQDFYRKYKKEVDYRLSLLHADVGSRYLRADDVKKAKKHLLSSILLRPKQKRVYLYLVKAIIRGLFCLPTY